MTDTNEPYEPAELPEDKDSDRENLLPDGENEVASNGVTSADAGLAELGAMQTAYAALVSLEESARQRAMAWLIESLKITNLRAGQVLITPSVDAGSSTRGKPQNVPDPREFMSHKKPGSQVERIACLAYYLARYRERRHFKSRDVSDLNIEAAGQKFGNLTRDIDNADRSSGYIVSAGQGAKQLTTRGEAVVDALPDREAVKVALQEHPYRPKRSTGGGKKGDSSAEDDR